MRLASTEEEKAQKERQWNPKRENRYRVLSEEGRDPAKKISFCNLQERVKNSRPFPILNSTVAAGAETVCPVQKGGKGDEKGITGGKRRIGKRGEGRRSKSLTSRFCCRVGPLYASPKGEQGFLFLPNHPLLEPTGYGFPKRVSTGLHALPAIA